MNINFKCESVNIKRSGNGIELIVNNIDQSNIKAQKGIILENIGYKNVLDHIGADYIQEYLKTKKK